MKSDSPLFDRIRVKPDKDRSLRAQCPACEWPNCQEPATHRAPKGRLREIIQAYTYLKSIGFR